MDLLALTNLVPGPNSTQMIMHVGFVRGGDLGTWIAGSAFIVPAFLLTLAISVVYVHLGTLPVVESLFYGMKPVIVALILTALVRMAQKDLRHPQAIAIFVLATIAAAMGVAELLVMGIAASWGLVRTIRSNLIPALLPLVAPLAHTDMAVVHPTSLGLLFLRFGATLYGSGYLLIAFIQNDLVYRLGWLTNQQLLDAIAIGQMTPGPILTTATAVGYIVLGLPGAILATTAIFLPSFFLVMAVGRWMDRLRESEIARGILDAVLPAVLGVILVVGYRLAVDALVDPFSTAMALAAVVALWRWKIDALLLILAAGPIGFLWMAWMGS